MTNGARDGVGLNPDRKVREEQYQRWYTGSDQRGGRREVAAERSSGPQHRGGKEGNVGRKQGGAVARVKWVRMH